MKKRIVCKLIVIISSLFINHAQAALLSVDTVPGFPPIDSSRNITSSPFVVDVLIDDVFGLAGFQFELGFDSSILDATSIISGDIFGSDTFPLPSTISGSKITFAETAFIFPGLNITDPVVIASIAFDVVGNGISDLILNGIVLSDSIGRGISGVTSENGQIDSTGLVRDIPEPSTLVLVLFGVMASFRVTRDKFRK